MNFNSLNFYSYLSMRKLQSFNQWLLVSKHCGSMMEALRLKQCQTSCWSGRRVCRRLTLKFITDQSTSDYGYNDTITNEIDFDKLLNETIAKQSLNTPSTLTAILALLKTKCSRHLYARAGYYIIASPCQ